MSTRAKEILEKVNETPDEDIQENLIDLRTNFLLSGSNLKQSLNYYKNFIEIYSKKNYDIKDVKQLKKLNSLHKTLTSVLDDIKKLNY